jgi:hypothetical protein
VAGTDGRPTRERPRRTSSACIERISTITDADCGHEAQANKRPIAVLARRTS